MNKRPKLINILVWILALVLCGTLILVACVPVGAAPDPSHPDVKSTFTLVAKGGNVEVWRMVDKPPSAFGYDFNPRVCYVAVNNYTSVASASISCP